MGETKPGAHRPKVGRIIPAKRGESGFQVLGQITLRLLGKLSGWDNATRREE